MRFDLETKIRREQQKLTQAELSQLSGVSIPMIQKLEYGDGNPSLNTMKKLSDALGFDIAIKERPVDWELICKAGVPLTGYGEYLRPVNKISVIREVKKAWNKDLDLRHREALAAFILAIKRHYKLMWMKHFKDLPTKESEDFDPNRMLKLSRIAISKIQDYF